MRDMSAGVSGERARSVPPPMDTAWTMPVRGSRAMLHMWFMAGRRVVAPVSSSSIVSESSS